MEKEKKIPCSHNTRNWLCVCCWVDGDTRETGPKHAEREFVNLSSYLGVYVCVWMYVVYKSCQLHSFSSKRGVYLIERFFFPHHPDKTSCRRCRGAITPSPPRRSTASLQTQSLTLCRRALCMDPVGGVVITSIFQAQMGCVRELILAYCSLRAAAI